MKIIIEPEGWPIKVEDCRPGAFMYKGQLCFKSEYSKAIDMGDGKARYDIEVFNSAGEYFMPRKVDVQPVTYVEVEE